MLPSLYTFDTLWEIPKRVDGQQLRGITLGVAQYVVGTFELEFKKKAGTSKTFVEKEPFWLNPEAFRAARALRQRGLFMLSSGGFRSNGLGTWLCLSPITD